MTAYWVDYGMSFVDNEAQFRFQLALQILFAIVTFTDLLFLPESPRWLIAHDRFEEARDVLSRIRIKSDAEDSVSADLAQIHHAIEEERAAAAGNNFRALIKDGGQRFRYRTLLGIGGQFMQQLSGINLITYYAPVIFQQSVGLSHSLSLLLAGFKWSRVFLLFSATYLDSARLGRRKLMLFACTGQACCMAILAGTIYTNDTAPGIVATVMLFLFNFFFAVGLLAIPWLLPAEYAPLAIRTKAPSLASASNWIFTFLVVEITPVSISSIGYKTYIYFAVFNACFLPLIYLFYPETRNLSLEQIDRLFTGPKVVMHIRDAVGGIDEVVFGKAAIQQEDGKEAVVDRVDRV